MKCPECGGFHKFLTSRAATQCGNRANYKLGHFLIRGLPASDERMIQARARANRWIEYEKTFTNK